MCVCIAGGTGLAGDIALADMNDGRKLAICVYLLQVGLVWLGVLP